MKLSIPFTPKTHYIQYGNFFSKTLIVRENAQFSPFIVCEKSEHVELYLKIADFLNLEIYPVEHIYDLVDIFYNKNRVFVASVSQLLSLSSYTLEKKLSFSIQKQQSIEIEDFIKKLHDIWYSYNEFSIPWSFKRQGDIVSVTHFRGKREYKVSFWGDVIEEIRENILSNDDIRSENIIERVFFWKKGEISECIWKESIVDMANTCGVFCVFDGVDFSPMYEELLKCDSYICFDNLERQKNSVSLHIWELNISTIEELKKVLVSKQNYIFTKNESLLKNFVEFNDIQNTLIFPSNSSILKSFHTLWANYICDDIILKVFTKRRVKQTASKDYDLLLKISEDDFVVHIDHGVGIYKGIVTKEIPITSINDLWTRTEKYIKKEYLEIHYKDNDKLFVPITEVERVTKYVGVDSPVLTSLSSNEWTKKLEKVGKDVEIIAQELLQIYAQRKSSRGQRFYIDSSKTQEFQTYFPYIYTQDQQKAIDEVTEDMASEKNMDRILIGDVWFWKTEVAFNALFHCVLNKKQAILITPLVVLAYEHFNKALERFSGFNSIRIGLLTRLQTDKEAKKVLCDLKEGSIDILIGTHRLLSEKVVYKNLWLIVIDEEHKFWVEDKEKIKKLKNNLDCLAMSATPIPRSLNMALSGIRDISMLREPPLWRKDIKTYVLKYDENIILEAWNKEFSRGWQMFFIHNRVENIEHMKNILERIFPGKKVWVTHGRLSWDELEDRIIDFKNKKYDILLSTTVIENGIDFSNVNTIFINECQSFWLSQIHQLRGRVGRSDKEGYCYLLYKKEVLADESIKRLKTIVKYSYLGSGFEIAIKDLEIRWGWDILGIRQSGQVTQIGVNLYLELLERKIEEIKQTSTLTPIETFETTIDLQVEAYIPDSYFNGEADKLNFYREIESIQSLEDIDAIRKDFAEINPNLGDEVKNLFSLLHLKIQSKKYKIISIKKVGIHYDIGFKQNIVVDELKKFLVLDKDVLFHIVSIDKIRTSRKSFKNDSEFLYYLLKMLDNTLENKKIKLKNTF